MVMCSSPLLGLFIMGLHSAYLFIKIDEEYQEREKDKKAFYVLHQADAREPEENKENMPKNKISPKAQNENDIGKDVKVIMKDGPLSQTELVHEILEVNDA